MMRLLFDDRLTFLRFGASEDEDWQNRAMVDSGDSEREIHDGQPRFFYGAGQMTALLAQTIFAESDADELRESACTLCQQD